MAEEVQRFKQYEYRANANLVLNIAEKRRLDEPSGEVQTLRGRELRPFGDRAQRGKPQELEDRMEKLKKRRDIQKEKAAGKKRRTEFADDARDVLAATADLETGAYRPKTRDTRAVYETLLSMITQRIGDQPQDVLRGAADEVLAVLKDDEMKDRDKKREVEKLLNPMKDEEFSKYYNVSRKITDYTPEEARPTGEDGLDEDIGVAVVFDEDEEEGDFELEEIVEEEDEEEEEGGVEARVDATLEITGEGEDDEMDTGEGAGQYDVMVQEIDAYWLQRNVAKYFPDAIEAQKMSDQLFAILQSDNDHESENQLVLMLGYDKFELVRLLMRNRKKIVFCTRLARAQTDEEREVIEGEMQRDAVGAAILSEMHGKKGEGHRRSEFEKHALQEVRTLKKMEGIDKEDKEDKPVARTVLDLASLTFARGGRFMANKKCELPAGSFRTQKKGYEEIHVPAVRSRIGEDERLISISELPDWTQKAFGRMQKLNRIQSQMFSVAFETGKNLLLCAPTGAGKTNVAMLAILHEIGLHRNKDGSINKDEFKIIYVAPMKSLVAEMVQNFGQRLQEFGITARELTGDVSLNKEQISETQIIVTTPEKWDIITRKSEERTYTQLVRLLIVDEIHLLHDDRGPVLESIVVRMIRQMEATAEPIRLIGLSATLPNYMDVGTLLRSSEVFFFDNSYRPVPLQQQFIGITEKKAIKRFSLMNEITYEKVVEKAGKNQVLVFVHSRKETGKTARAIRDMATEHSTLDRFLKDNIASREILQSEAEAVKNPELRELLPHGFGIHHAGMDRSDRDLVEDLFADGHIQVLISTATLAWGVNLPAHTVIIKGTQIYSPEKGKWVELSPLDVMQMMGRAGRPQYDKQGEGIIITSHQELQYYLSLFNQQLPIESQLISRLPDVLNAEVVLGTVQNIQEAAEWITYTYLYIRMKQNPTLYGVSAEDVANDKTLEWRRVDLVHTAATMLDKHNLVKYDRKTGQLQVTDLGRVASHYYIHFNSIATYNEHLKPSMSDIELFRLFSLSNEFKYMNVREEEKLELAKLVERTPIPIKESIEEASAKVNVLLQAYISRLSLEGFALVSDMVFIHQSAGRIMRALYEIVLRRGWVQLADKCLNLSKMIDKRMWGSQTPLRQFRAIPEDILRKLEKKELLMDHLLDISPHAVGELIRVPKLGAKMHKFIHQFPKLDMTAHVQPITRNTLQVELTLTPDFLWDDAIHGSAEPFWIWVEDVDSDVLLHFEPFFLKSKFQKSEHIVNFTVPIYEPLPPQYFIRAVSDRWIGSEVILPISFRHLILPEKYPPPTELLDLQPLPLTAFKNPTFEGLYSKHFQALNAIQTQVFNVLYNTDDNVLVAAPTGSGKTLCAEMAVVRAFTSSKQAKVVYVAPLEALANERYQDWLEKFGVAFQKQVVKLTGDTPTDLKLLESDIIISTPERWDMISRRWKNRKNVQNVNLFVVDEAHLIGGEKGPTLEVVVSRMRYISAHFDNRIRIVGLSASLANAKDLGEWLGAKGHSLFNFPPTARPVPLEIHIQGFTATQHNRQMLQMNKPMYQAIVKHAPEKPVIVFVAGRKMARSVAVEIVSSANALGTRGRFLHAAREDITPFLENVNSTALQMLLEDGVAFYHEGLSENDRDIVQNLFNSGAIQVVVSAHNMCWGMVMSSHLVVIMGTQYYEGREHRYADYPIADILQMMGRTSRPLHDDSGRVVLMCQASKKDFYKKFLYDPLPLESHLDHVLADHFNAEIVTKTIENKQDAVDYLTWTFLYRRLTQNPNYYNLHGVSHRHLSDHLSELVETTLAVLDQSKCIAIENDMDVAPLNLGMIAHYYYIRYTTIELFASSLQANTRMKGLIEILSSASEFSELPVRHKEDKLLRQMALHLPNKIDQPTFHDPHTKTNILLQGHFSRRSIPADLAVDQKHVLEESTRLLQAMVDVVSSSGWLKPALAIMELSQMVVQAMWEKDSLLVQLPHFSKDVVDRFTAARINTVFDILEMESDEERQKLLDMTPQQMSDVARACNSYPNIDLTHQIVRTEVVDSGLSAVVEVKLEREEDTEIGPVHAPYFPKEKVEGWWLVVGDPTSNQLLSIKRLTLARRATVKLDFVVPEGVQHKITLYFMSDSYMGCDQEYELDIEIPEDSAVAHMEE